MKTTYIIGPIGGGGSLRYIHEARANTETSRSWRETLQSSTGKTEGMVIGFTNGAQSN